MCSLHDSYSSSEVTHVSFVPLQSGSATERDSLLDRPEPSNWLTSFPPEATLSFAWDGEDPLHVSERIPQSGIAVIGTFHDLVDSRAAMRTLTRTIKSSRVAAFVLTGHPDVVGDSFRREIAYARQVGGASEVFVPSRELAVLLGTYIPRDGGRNRLCNGLILVMDGAIVWHAIADAKRPDTSHNLDGLTAALAPYLS